MLSPREFIILCVIILFCGFISGPVSAEWIKSPPDPLPDVDKEPPGDMSCWLATASNMLAGAGYGDGTNIQERAVDLYNELIAHFGRFD